MAPSHLSHHNKNPKAIILPNELSDLDNITYKIKFFMIHPNHPNGIKGDALDKKYVQSISKIIIAETGKTNSFYIKDLGFSNAVSYRMQIMPMGITGQLNIIEPYGMSLYERLVAASYKLKIENHLTAKYIIQINFQGYKPDGEQTIVEYEWFVPVLVKKITSSVTEQGSDYTLQFVGMNYKANTNVSNTGKEPFRISAVTFGEFLDEYVAALNKHQQDLVIEGSQMKADKFIIKFDDGYGPGLKVENPWSKHGETPEAVREFLLGANEPTTEKTARRQVHEARRTTIVMGQQAVSKIVLTASKGTSIDAFITGVFMQTPEMKERTKSGASIHSEDIDKEKKGLDKIKIVIEHETGWYDLNNKWFMTVSTDIIEGEWDPIRNQYQKTYIKTLHQYRVYHVVRDGYEHNAKRRNLKDLTKDKMRALTEHGLLRKAYFWIYTGKNTEVLNFNFAFDNLYYVASDIYMFSSLGERAQCAGTGRMDAEDSHQTVCDQGVDQPADPTARPTDIHPPLQFEEYLEDIPLTASSTQIDPKPFSNPSFIPDATPRYYIYGTSPGGAQGAKDPGRVVYNINSGDMMELQLQIKGDPFWLGHTGSGSKNIPEDKFAPYSKGANYLYVEFKVPHKGVDPDSGQMSMDVANTISGIYFITNVQSNFSDGQFVQSLTGYLDVHFGLTQVRNTIGIVDDRIT